MTKERKPAFKHWKSHVCVICGYSVKEVLQVAHLLGKKKSRKIKDTAIMCQNHHREFDIGLIPLRAVIYNRNWREKWVDVKADHKKLIGLTDRQLKKNARIAVKTRERNEKKKKRAKK